MKKSKSDYKMLGTLILLILFAGIIVSASLLQENSGNRDTFSVNIVSPTGGEAWQGNTEHTISYTISGGVPNYTVELFYTTDNVNFNFIDYDNGSAEGSFDYTWTTPGITSENVKVKVVVTDNVTGNTSSQVSDISNAFEIDSTPPGDVTDLSVWNITKTSVTLNWTASGDDGSTGTATEYDIRYSESEIDDTNWADAIQCTDESTPSEAGATETFAVTGLSPGTTYYFALKSTDNVGLISNLSNCVNASTLLNVTLISPVGNEEWKGNTNYTIDYGIAGTEPNYTVELYYAYNNSDFIFIGYDNRTEAATHQYNWTTPNILSVSVKVKINVTDNTGFSDAKISDEFEIDSIPPGKINDLTVTGVTADSVTLSWSAPGEDGTLYKVTNTTDEDNLSIPDNIPAGVTSNLTLSDNIMIDNIRVYLRINHTYVANLIVKLSHPDNTTVTLFDRSSGGSDDNIWGWYEGNTFTTDPGGSVNIQPAIQPAGDISVFKDKSSKGIWKLWVSDNSGGESGAIDYWKIEVKTGKVATYELRYNTTSEITEANWGNSTSYTAPVPGIPGSVENLCIIDLSPGVKYYFALKSTDNVGWGSDVSNSVSATTLLDVEVLSPNGNQLWSGESEQIIKYKFSGSKSNLYDVYDVYIWCIYDGTMVSIPTVPWHNETGTYECNWTTPKINSTNVKIRVNITVAGHSYGEDDSDTNFTIDSASPKVLSATPANNTYVLHDENIIITFNESMNTTSVENAFSITPYVANLTWAWNIDSTIATISHDDFTENQLYNCIVNTTAKDISEPGNPLLEDYIFNFTVVEPLDVRVIYPNGNETLDGTKNQTIAYEILGGAPPYNVTLYWVNATDGVTKLIGYDTNSSAGEHSWTWVAPSITNNTLKIKISIVDNTTPFQAAYDLTDWFFEIDSTAPGKPDLEEPAPNSIAVEGYPRAHAVKLNWISLGDDGAIGKASYYDLRCYDSYITEENWDDIPSYWQFTYNAVASTGEFDSYVINGLEPDKVYYFRLKAYDNIGFASELSNCVSIKTLKFEIWPDAIQGESGIYWDAANKTVYIHQSKTVTYTEVLMKGSLRVVNNVDLKFEKVLFIMDCTVDWKYSIQVAPGGLAGFLEGGKFELQYSNISASVSTMPDGSERWHPYLFTAYRNSIFWMFYSSMHHCGGRPEDIENIELDFAQMDVDLDVELGIEIRSSDVSIENSIISQNWGLFIRTSLPMQASPTIKYNTIEHNRYGMVIKPRIDIAEQWPINLIVNNITDNGVGVYSDSARVGLEGCHFIRNTYGVIYNNTPLDWPHNVSGVIYHCVFEGNVHGITSTTSSLRMETVTMANNIYALNATASILNIKQSEFLDNAGGIYCSLSSLDVFDSTISNSKALIEFETYEKRNVSETGKAEKAYPVEEEITSSGNYSYGILSLLTPTNISGTIIVIDVDGNITTVTITTWSDGSKSKTTVEYSDKVGIGVLCAGRALNFIDNRVKDSCAGLMWMFSEARITNNTFQGCIEGVLGSGTTDIPDMMDRLPGIKPPVVLPAPILRRILQGIEEINVEGALSGNEFVDNVYSTIIFAGNDITIDNSNFTGNLSLGFNVVINGVSGLIGEGGEGILLDSSTFTIDNCFFLNYSTGIDLSGSTGNITNANITGILDWSIGMLISSSECRVDDSIIDKGVVGILYFDSTINIKDVVIQNNPYANILSLHLYYWWWYPEYAADIVEHSVLNLDNVSVLRGTYYGQAYGVATSNTTVTITNSNISENDVGIYCEFTDISIENVNVTYNNGNGVYVSASTLNATHTNFTGNTVGISASNAKIYVTECDFKDNSRHISSSSSSGYIGKLNTMKGGTGVDSLYSDLLISDNHFIDCIAGVNSNNDFLEITGNVMEGCDEGIILTSSSGNITGNKIDGLGVAGSYTRGIRVSYQGSGEIYIADNEIWGYQYGCGVYCRDAYPTIVNNILAENVIGIYFIDSNERYATIEENTICNNTYGIQSTNSNLNIINNTVGWNIPNGEVGSNTYGVYGQQKSRLNIIGNDINHNYYGVGCEGSTLNVTGNSLSWNTYGIHVIPYITQSVTLYSSSVTLYSSACINGATISNNSYGAYFKESSLSISNTSIVNNNIVNDSYGVYLYECPDPEFPGTPVKIINSTITNNIMDLNISDSRVESVTSTIGIIYLSSSTISSTLDCVDFTPDFNNITFADNNSKMGLSFYLTVFVKWQNNEPVNNASVIIYNKNNVPTNLSTDTNGIVYAKILALRLNKTTLPDGVTFMPHRVNVSKYDIFNETGPFCVNETRYIEIVLYDLKKPSISINPVFFNITNNPLLTLTGTASDNIEIWGVEFSTDNVTWGECNLSVTNSTAGNYVVGWSGSVILSEGLNTVYVMVKDFAGNNKTDSITITLDTTPPTLTITSSIPETTNQSILTITGKTEPDAVLTINTVSVEVDENGNFGMTFSLSEGVNVFTVVASDPLGNENRKVLSIVVFDNTPPTSGIAYIKSPTNSLTSITGIANDDISGVKKVEISIIRGSDGYYWTGSAWSSTETWLTANGTSAWSYSWTHESDGVYTIKSRAVDNADNTETPSSGIIFTYDKTPPTLTNIKPSNNSETESETITVSGETDGVNVTVNGKYADIKDGKFSATVKLGTGNNGKNVITIIAKDQAGNTNQTILTVKRISTEWFPPGTQWITVLVGIIVIALIAVVFVLYKKKIIKLKAPKEKTETGKVRENVLHKEKMGTGKPKENVGFLSKED